MARALGLEPRTTVLETAMLPITPDPHMRRVAEIRTHVVLTYTNLGDSRHRPHIVVPNFFSDEMHHMYTTNRLLAEGVGFEPTEGYPSPPFQGGTFVRSVIPL